MTEWSCSGWIVSDFEFVQLGNYIYCFQQNDVAKIFRELAETVRHTVCEIARVIGEFIGKHLPELIEVINTVMEESEQDVLPRQHWKPVRYIRASDRRTDSRPPVYHIRSALPNMRRDRRMKREGD